MVCAVLSKKAANRILPSIRGEKGIAYSTDFEECGPKMPDSALVSFANSSSGSSTSCMTLRTQIFGNGNIAYEVHTGFLVPMGSPWLHLALHTRPSSLWSQAPAFTQATVKSTVTKGY